MNYTLHQLQVFLKVSQTKSITRAAEELHLTQPAVSIQLKNFQDQFEFPLTEIINRRLYMTDFGLEIAKAAQNILNEVATINDKTLAFKGKMSGTLKISVVSTGKYVMPYFLSGFVGRNEGIDLQMDVTNKSKVVESLKNNEVDFSLVSLLPDNLSIEWVELMQNKLFLVGSPHWATEMENNEKHLLETLPLIFRETGSGTRFTMEQFISENSLTVRKKLELTSNEAVKQAVIAGLGYSIMPLIGIKNELSNGDLHIIPIPGLPIKSNWNLIWLKGKKFSPVANAFLQYVQAEKDSIVQDKFSWFEAY
jgi:LysR family transcriptional regulator, low CO2-responsive transcriptional regulator